MGDAKDQFLPEQDHEILKQSDADDDDNNPETRCGLGIFRPPCLQVFANMVAFTGSYSIAALLTSTLLSYVNSQVTTLERQFGLTSSETGIVMASNDIGYVVVVVFIGYFSRRVHIPRFLSICTFFCGLAGLLCCLPHFLFGVQESPETLPYNVSSASKESDVEICSDGNKTEDDRCLENEQDLSSGRGPRQHATVALTMIAIGMTLQGMAKAPRHPFSITYIDDNVPKVKTGFYVGITISLSIFGPAIAFGLGSYFTRLYVTLGETDLYPRHPRWIGAWWLGFLVFGAIAVLVSVPLIFFPRRMKGTRRFVEVGQNTKGVKHTASETIVTAIKNYFQLVLSLVTNPVYACLVLGAVCNMFTIGGSHAFMPKYLETQFGMPAWKANLLMGTTTMCMASLGTFFGGWLTKKFKILPLTGLKLVLTLTVVTLGLTCLGFVFGCQQPRILNQPGSNEVHGAPPCSKDCHCNDQDFFPICGADNNNYYSPCHAGCGAQSGNLFENCTCIPGEGSAYAGFCDYDCSFLYPFIVSSAVGAFLGTTMIMCKVLAQIRCVPESEKSMCIALSTCMTSIFGWLLGPIIFGRIVDSTCMIWDTSCGERGACALYSIVDFRMKMHGYVVFARFLALMCVSAAFVFSRKRKTFDKYTHSTEEKGSQL